MCATCVLIIRNKYKFTLLDNVHSASAAGLSQYGDVKHHEAKSDTERSVEIVPSLPSGMQGEASRDKRPHLPGVQGECPDQEKWHASDWVSPQEREKTAENTAKLWQNLQILVTTCCHGNMAYVTMYSPGFYSSKFCLTYCSGGTSGFASNPESVSPKLHDKIQNRKPVF